MPYTRVANKEESQAIGKLLARFNPSIFQHDSLISIEVVNRGVFSNAFVVQTSDKKKHFVKIEGNIEDSKRLDATIDFMRYMYEHEGSTSEPYKIPDTLSPYKYIQKIPRDIDGVDMPPKWRNAYFCVSKHLNMGPTIHQILDEKEFAPENKSTQIFEENTESLLKGMASCVAKLHKSGESYQKDHPESMLFKENKFRKNDKATNMVYGHDTNIYQEFSRSLDDLHYTLRKYMGINMPLQEILLSEDSVERLRLALKNKLNAYVLENLKSISEILGGKLDSAIAAGNLTSALRLGETLVLNNPQDSDVKLSTADTRLLEELLTLEKSLSEKDSPLFKSLTHIVELSKDINAASTLPKSITHNDAHRGNFMWHQENPASAPELHIVDFGLLSRKKHTPTVYELNRLLIMNAKKTTEAGEFRYEPTKAKLMLDSYDAIRPVSAEESRLFFNYSLLHAAKPLLDSLVNVIKTLDTPLKSEAPPPPNTVNNEGPFLAKIRTFNDLTQLTKETPIQNWLDEVRAKRKTNTSEIKSDENTKGQWEIKASTERNSIPKSQLQL